MGPRQRLCPALERSREVWQRPMDSLSLSDDGDNSREYVLHTMVELRQQGALLFLHPFALGYVNADADDSVWALPASIDNEAARLDPSQLTTRPSETVLYRIFALTLTERLTAELFHPS